MRKIALFILLPLCALIASCNNSFYNILEKKMQMFEAMDTCSKSLYYAWEGPEWGYCTLEVKAYQVIFRGTAPLFLQSEKSMSYIYLYGNDSKKYFNNFKEKVFTIDINSFDTRYCLLENIHTSDAPPPFRMGGFETSIKFFNNPDRSISYVKRSGSPDTVFLVGYGAKGNQQYKFEHTFDYPNVEDSVLISKGIVWFPPEMYRVEKIEYEKFGERLQHLNLKNPWKGTKNGHPKNYWLNFNVY